jgi:hypothetical protein
MTMAQFMRDDEIEGVHIIAAGFYQIRIEHDKSFAPEFGCERVQNASGLQQVLPCGSYSFP